METCMSLGEWGQWIARRGFGRAATVDELLRLLERTEKLGLVHLGDNVLNEPAYICNCCSCCCGVLSINRKFGKSSAHPSNFITSQEEDICDGCGACADICPVQAITMSDACKKRGLFGVLEPGQPCSFNLLVEKLEANSGHLHVVLNLLESLNWVSCNSGDDYLLTPEAETRLMIPEDIMALMSFPMHDYVTDNKEEKYRLGKWIELSRRRWNTGDPERLIEDLEENGIQDVEKILHVRSFLYHDRPYIPPLDTSSANVRANISGEGVHVDREGNVIPPGFVMQSLVEHLERWSEVIGRHGLLMLDFKKKLPTAGLHNLYGPTEAAVDVTFWQCEEREDKKVPIGRPISNIKIYILDSESKQVPIGQEGELYIGGIGLARGYLNRPELTAEKFVNNPFSNESGAKLYKTGDKARFLLDGNIEYLGRIDFQVKVRGNRK
jgi:ferredoxin